MVIQPDMYEFEQSDGKDEISTKAQTNESKQKEMMGRKAIQK